MRKHTGKNEAEIHFLCYPKCTTCKKARKFLEEKGISFKERDIKENRPTFEELKLWISASGLPIKRFFNTSGQLYRSLGVKDKLETMKEEEILELLSSDGMLVKRPLLVAEEAVLAGFKEQEWTEFFGA